MRLPKNLLSDTYKKPNLFLCEPDKSKICKLDTSNTKATLKFNSYSELTTIAFESAVAIVDVISVNNFRFLPDCI